MLKPYFVPAPLLQAGIDYSNISPAELATLARALSQPAVGFGKNSKPWRHRAVKAWEAVAREWERWKFPEAEEALHLLQTNARMSAPVLHESIANHFRVIDADEMTNWLQEIHEARAEDPGRLKYPPLAFLIASGNIPGAAIQQMVQFSLLGIPTLIKSASSEPNLMPAILATLARHDAEIASRLVALSWPRENHAVTQAALDLSPQVVALGDDDTMKRLQSEVKGAWMPFGDRFSAAIIHAAGVKVQTLRKLVYDHAMFDGKGCLSPQVVMVIAEHWQEVEKLAVHFAGVLAEENQKWPAGNWSADEKAMIQQWRGAWQAQRAAGEKIALLQPTDVAWTVVAAEEFDLEQRVAFRCVRLLWMKHFDEVLLALENYSEKIQALAVEIKDDEYAELALDLDEAEETLGRLICEPGELQRPFFSWMAINRKWFELTYGVKL
ncbi:MAG: acyl-CoA reductase [bacterium]